MVLKKQTVWLLTMLSLIIVLSVYYVQSPGPVPGEEVAFDEIQEETEMNLEELAEGDANEVVVNIAEELEEAEAEEGLEETESGVISSISTNEAFATIRMELQASRDRMAEEYTQIVASSDVSAELKSEAHDKSIELQRLAQKESQLETLIMAKGFEDALVMAEDDQVRVIVQTEELSREQANEILSMTYDHLGSNNTVTVAHQATK
ncbi:stage III sporulation protein AH [Halalkalibacter wakoensis JCM 9140]|uniref:Stage III sporulation protein AH n=1 Tax=Halalkalibacter wakoensis JCM 9140 TaxID=1236970 RepID=W4PZQ6_9BACI|nr:SpoIIIAH-like family protein [Halalkalibacter wakoensis]GAE24599.1 stage III sporulation protein AH [Halalkalibacter wakoensis JCM 9140]